MPSKREIEAAAKALFRESLGGKIGTYHWPGEAPRQVEGRFAEEGMMTVSADHPEAPGQGSGPDQCRATARLALKAAEAIRAEDKQADLRQERMAALDELQGLSDGDSLALMLVELGYDGLSDKGIRKLLAIQRQQARDERKFG